MSTNVIKQTLIGKPGSQTIKMVVRSNERGPKGDKGEPGIQGPQGIPGPRGYDGVIQYKAGTGINISAENIITATGDATAAWGGIQGNINSQTDLQSALNAKQDVMADFVGANGIVGGKSGKVPAPAATDNVKFLKGDGTWSTAVTPDGTVTTAKIVDAAVTTAKINDGAITTAKVEDAAITTAKLAGNAVVSGKIAADAVTTNTINDGAVTAAKIDFSTMPGNYSTTEIDTGYTWIDGSAIYKKTINVGTLPSSPTTKNVAHNISNLGTVIKIEGIYSNSGNNFVSAVNSPISSSNADSYIRTTIQGSNIVVNVGMDRSDLSGYVTLYYTKTS